MVTYQPGAGGRYRLLEPTRQYAAEKLQERADTRRFEDAHARYYLERLQEASPHLKGADTAIWLPRLLPNLENFRAAAERLLEHGDPVHALELVVAGAALWFHRRLSDEALRWLERAREKAGPLPPEPQARVHRAAGFLDLSNPARARKELDAAIAKFAELGLEEEAAQTRVTRMLSVVAEGDSAAFIRLIEELGAFYEPRPDSWFYGHLPAHRAVAALHDLNVDLALAECQEGLRRVRASGDISASMSSLLMGMHMYWLVGEHATADELAQETVSIGQKFDPWLAGTGFAYLALGKWLGGERLAARELAMKALGCYATMSTLNLVHVTKFRHIRAVTSTEPRFADYENLVRLPPRAGAFALMKGMFDELAMLDSALGREELAAEFREAAEELNTQFEAALQTSSQGS